jgi:prolyl 4-hydroxylase
MGDISSPNPQTPGIEATHHSRSDASFLSLPPVRGAPESSSAETSLATTTTTTTPRVASRNEVVSCLRQLLGLQIPSALDPSAFTPSLSSHAPTPACTVNNTQEEPERFVPPPTVFPAASGAVVNQQNQQQPEQQLPPALVQSLASPGIGQNLIPLHLQASNALAASLHDTAGNPSFPLPALLATLLLPQQHPTLTVQDRPMTPPVYNGINPNYPGLRVLNTSPPMFAVDNFLTPLECEFLIHMAQDSFGPAPVVGKGAGEVSPSRTSSTCYLSREDLPDLMRKVSSLTGKPIEHCELPQVGRYFPSQQYLQHYDAFDLGTEDGLRFAANGGQRTITVLLYLNDVARGGATRFPALNLDVQPRQGMALVFFPATIDGMLDRMALHAAMPAVDTKYVSQVWIRQGHYAGQPSKRLPQIMGAPLGPPFTTPQPATAPYGQSIPVPLQPPGPVHFHPHHYSHTPLTPQPQAPLQNPHSYQAPPPQHHYHHAQQPQQLQQQQYYQQRQAAHY